MPGKVEIGTASCRAPDRGEAFAKDTRDGLQGRRFLCRASHGRGPHCTASAVVSSYPTKRRSPAGSAHVG
jgi:hypothetical protein